jgi:hypothetical protein
MSAPAPNPLRPYVDDVARLIRARTKDDQGQEVGTFTANTRPTADQVEAHIDAALALMSSRIPPSANMPEALWPAARNLVAYRAALQIEKSYFPEQVRADRSAYQHLREEYNDDLQALLAALAESGAGVPGSRRGSELTPTWLHEYAFGAAGLGWTPAMLTWVEPYGDVGVDYWPQPENPQNWQSRAQPPREGVAEDLPVGQIEARPAKDVRP